MIKGQTLPKHEELHRFIKRETMQLARLGPCSSRYPCEPHCLSHFDRYPHPAQIRRIKS